MTDRIAELRARLDEVAAQVEALDRENHRMRRCVTRLMARLTVWLDEDQFNEADEIMSSAFEPPAQKPMTEEEIASLSETQVGTAQFLVAKLHVREAERHHGIGKGESK